MDAVLPSIPPPPVRALVAGMGTGSVALLMLGLQSLLLGRLADEGRLDIDGIAAAATVELLALGVTTGLLSAFAKPSRLRMANAVAALALTCADAWEMFCAHGWLVVSRGAAGMASGVLVWIAVSLITRAGRADRAAGVFLTVQTLAQAVLAAALPLTLMSAYGAIGSFAALTSLALAAAAFSICLATKLAPLPPVCYESNSP